MKINARLVIGLCLTLLGLLAAVLNEDTRSIPAGVVAASARSLPTVDQTATAASATIAAVLSAPPTPTPTPQRPQPQHPSPHQRSRQRR